MSRTMHWVAIILLIGLLMSQIGMVSEATFLLGSAGIISIMAAAFDLFFGLNQ